MEWRIERMGVLFWAYGYLTEHVCWFGPVGATNGRLTGLLHETPPPRLLSTCAPLLPQTAWCFVHWTAAGSSTCVCLEHPYASSPTVFGQSLPSSLRCSVPVSPAVLALVFSQVA